MNAKWGWAAPLAMVFLCSLIGCRHTQPDLKPPEQAEVFNSPSTTASLTGYPKQAFRFDDPSAKTDLEGNTLQLTKGAAGGPPSGSFGGPSGGMR
jgi:hypothetical protein